MGLFFEKKKSISIEKNTTPISSTSTFKDQFYEQFQEKIPYGREVSDLIYDQWSEILAAKFLDGKQAAIIVLDKHINSWLQNGVKGLVLASFLNGLCVNDVLTQSEVQNRAELIKRKFSVQAFGNNLNNMHEYIYLSVIFDNSSLKSYSYIADDESIGVGDIVDVPVGNYGDVAVGRVIRKEHFTEMTAPFAPEKTKHIIGLHK